MPGEVFISYAREDTDFVRRLHAALTVLNRDTWVDWEDIPLTADWWREIQAGIEAANTFVFVISPDSAQSDVCYREIDHAALHNKRLMPIMHRMIADPAVQQKLHPAVNAHNWAFFRDMDDFDTAFSALIDAMDTDLSYVREHTRLLVRARNWEERQHDPSQLLRDNELRAAEAWLKDGLPKERNHPSDLHMDYLRRSRRAQNRRTQRTVGLAILIALIIGLMIVSLLLREEAEQKSAEAAKSAEEARIAEENAIEQNEILQAISLAAQARLELVGAFPERGVLLALESLAPDRPHIWEAERALGEAIQSSRARSIFTGHEEAINDVAWSPDGTRIVTASATTSGSGSALIWDAASGEPLFTLSGHTDIVTSVAWSPDSRYIVTGSRDTTAKIWDPTTGEEIDTIFGHEDEWVNDVAWSPDGATIATASNDDAIKLWNAADRLAVAFSQPDRAYTQQIPDADPAGAEITLIGHERAVKAVAWSPDSSALVTVSDDQTIRIWNAADGSELMVLGGGDDGHTDSINAVDWSSNGLLIVTSSYDDTAKVWDAATGTLLVTVRDHIDDVTGVMFSPDSAVFATASKDRTIRVYDVTTGSQLFTALGHTNDINSIDWSPDSTRFITGSKDKNARSWNLQPGYVPVTLIGHQGRVTSADWSPDNTHVFTTSTDNTVRIWDTTTGVSTIIAENGRGGPNSAAWSPDGAQVAIITRSNTIDLRDPASGYLLLTITPAGTPTSAAWTATSAQIITPVGSSVIVWDATTGEEIKRLDTASQLLWAELSPDDTQLLTVARSNPTISVWDFVTGELLQTFDQHVDSVSDAAWSPDGTRIVSGDAEGTGYIWKALTGEILNTLNGHRDGITGVDWSPEGTRVITSSRDRSARVWAADTGNELLAISEHTDELADAAWSPDGAHAVTTSGDQTTNVWPMWLTSDELLDFALNCCIFRELTAEEREQFSLETD